MTEKPIAAGKSSFNLVDSKKLFSELRLKENTTLLDLACGSGAYSIAASEYIGEEGLTGLPKAAQHSTMRGAQIGHRK